MLLLQCYRDPLLPDRKAVISTRIMPMSYAMAVEALFARGHELAHASDDLQPADFSARPPVVRRKFSLDQMRELVAELGHPERTFRSVLIAGTNGKGSTSAMLANIVRSAGHRVGLYTSPHLSRVNERIQIEGVAIPDEDFARLYFRVDEAGTRLVQDGRLPSPPSFFETMTAVAFLYFAERLVDLAVLEVGMGGRLDATNVVQPLLSVITDISLDHTEWLGTTIAAIAREKAGILRPGGTLITLPQHPEANQVLGEVAVELGVKAISAVDYLPPHLTPEHETAWRTTYSVTALGTPVELSPALAGTHQHRNTALAVASAIELCNSNGYKMASSDIAQGIATAQWPGRLELFPPTESRCAVLLDVAHNPAGIWTLRSAVAQYLATCPTSMRTTLLFGCLRDKAVQEMTQILFPIFNSVIVTPVSSPRTASAEELREQARSIGTQAAVADSPEQGLSLALQQQIEDELIVCAGSIYLVGPVRQILIASPDAKVEKSAAMRGTSKEALQIRESTGISL